MIAPGERAMPTPPTGTVTFLFTDIEGSTRRWDAQPDAMQQALRRHDAILREAIEAHDGHVFKSMGDAFYAAFARATDAVAAAVAVQRALAAEPWAEASPGRVRMALHTGAADERDGDYFGPPLNRVARLLEAGHGGQVLLSGATAELVRDRLPEGVQLRDLGEHRLRDLARPDRVHQLAIWGLPADFPAVRSARDLRTTPPTPASTFVGRSAELAGLRAALDAALAGHGRLVLVSGEPGIGKTRLAQELSAESEAGGCLVLWGRCWEGEGAPAFWPWLDALSAYVRTLDPRTLRAQLGPAAPDLALLVPDVQAALPDLPPPPPAEPEQARFRLFGGVSAVLTGVAAARPLLLVLDDLHWADKPSLLLLQFLVRQIGAARVLVLGLYRDTDLDRQHPLAEALVALRREPIAERVALGGLSRDEVAALVEARAGHVLDAPGRALAAAIERETEGNPFFIEETLRHLVETGRVARSDGRWVVTVAPDQLDIPEGVRQVIGRRLSRLSAEANVVLAQAAVIGREFDEAVLQAVTDADEATLDRALEEALAAGLIAESRGRGQPGYSFGHALIRQTLYDELRASRRQRLHLRVAEAIEHVHARSLDRRLAALAMHYREAGAAADPEKAIEYSLRAGEAADVAFAYEEAYAQWRAALELLDDAGPERAEERARLLARLGYQSFVTGLNWEEGIGYLEESLRAYEALRLPDRVTEIHIRLGRYLSGYPLRQDLPRAATHFRAAEAALSAATEREPRCQLQIGLALVALWEMQTEEALVVSRQAMNLATELGDERLWAEAAIFHGWALAATGRPSDAVEVMEQAWLTADRLGHVYAAVMATWIGQAIPALLLDPADTRRWLERELARPRLSRAYLRDLFLGMAADAAADVGDLAGAHDYLAQQSVSAVPNAYVSYLDGEWASALEEFRSRRERAHRTGDQVNEANLLHGLAGLQQRLGDSGAAETSCQQSLAIVSGRDLVREVRARTRLALVLAEADRPQDAQPDLTRCRDIIGNGEDWRGLVGRVALAEGAAAGREGRLDEATAHFTRAVEVFRRYSVPFEEADAFVTWGRTLLAAGDGAAALARLEEAAAIYERIGAAPRWLERIEPDRQRAREALAAGR
jgi:class 3 adenylate cyclase/tetratricopeptide (TPR) repeat protein